MPFIYHDPATVLSPKRFIKKLDVLYDGGEEGFSLAMIDWEGLEHVGMRWNIAIKERDEEQKKAGEIKCSGSPVADDIPSWFILPRELFNPVLFDKDSEMFLKMVEAWGSP